MQGNCVPHVFLDVFDVPDQQLEDMQLVDLAKMVAIDGEGDRQWELLWEVEKRPEEQAPVMPAFFALDADLNNGGQEGGDFFPLQGDCVTRWVVIPEECAHPFVETLGGIDRIEDLTVALLQLLQVHFRDDVGLAIDVIAGIGVADTAVAQHALVKLGADGRLQEADHGRHDPALLDEFDHALKDSLIITVKPDDETAHHL